MFVKRPSWKELTDRQFVLKPRATFSAPTRAVNAPDDWKVGQVSRGSLFQMIQNNFNEKNNVFSVLIGRLIFSSMVKGKKLLLVFFYTANHGPT